MFAYLIYKLAGIAIRLQPLGVSYTAAALIAEAHYRLDRRARAAVIQNLERVFGGHPPPEGHQAVARRVFQHFGRNVVDFLRIPGLDLGRMQQLVEIEGWEHLEAVRRQGKGAVLLSAHLGNWEWGAVLLSQLGIRVLAVARPHRSARVTALFTATRSSQGVESLPLHGSSFSVLRALRRGDFVAITGDRELTGQGIRARFFGEDTWLPRAHVTLAVKTGVPIVPAFMEQRPGGRFYARILPAIEVGGSHAHEPLETLLARCSRVLEGAIFRCPDQWFVFEPIWNGGPRA